MNLTEFQSMTEKSIFETIFFNFLFPGIFSSYFRPQISQKESSKDKLLEISKSSGRSILNSLNIFRRISYSKTGSISNLRSISKTLICGRTEVPENIISLNSKSLIFIINFLVKNPMIPGNISNFIFSNDFLSFNTNLFFVVILTIASPVKVGSDSNSHNSIVNGIGHVFVMRTSLMTCLYQG